MHRERLNLTSWGRPEMTSRGNHNLTSIGRLSKVDLGHPQDVPRLSPSGPSKHVLGIKWGYRLDVPKFIFSFLLELIRLAKSI